MHSAIPKVLHRLAGKTLLEHVIDTAKQLSPIQPPIVIFGRKSESMPKTLAHLSAKWVLQSQQLGTGHALQTALPHLSGEQVLVLYGDVPLVSVETLKELIVHTPPAALGILTAHFPDPRGLGRILRNDQHKIIGIIEEKDATAAQRAIQEINSGIYLIPTMFLKTWLPKLKKTNAQAEYYLTDIVPMAVEDRVTIHSLQPAHWEEALGVNDCVQLAYLERYYQQCYANQLMRQGTTLRDPARFDVRGELNVGQDVIIDVNVIIEGQVTIGNRCVIGPNTCLKDVTLGDDVEIKANSIIEGAEIAAHCQIGPFARIRPHTQLAEKTHIGNFVEIKNSLIGQLTKINHLSYIGDSTVGHEVNVGAGTITCNYDGANKHRTVIGDHVFIGSNSQLVAPLTIGEGATIGAGSTITQDAPPHQLTLARAPQCTIKNWVRPKKKGSNHKDQPQ